ncbi:redoxin domain-containing protein [Pseudomonas jinjuensis]|uniref:Peroxiredoxin n=1 Tax=Pseudomonas jinjuensis TaxID=198616 RepID=A0A1G9YMI3_9PSED|nr:redoxin domain-containing protein [Pseudomonas jinjuensis]SDN10388.1 Peroxiredoxin [Pseudomonas jinjuensis]
MQATLFSVGDPVPWFHCRTRLRERFYFDNVAGRYVVLSFFESAGDPGTRGFLAEIHAARQHFNDNHLSFFGVSTDPDDEKQGRIEDELPGVRYFWDFDRAVSRRYGVLDGDGRVRATTYLLDPTLRVLAVIPPTVPVEERAQALIRHLDDLPALPSTHPATEHAPVIVVPRVFEPSLCEALIRYYEEQGGTESGFMVEQDGKTIEVSDHAHKRRRDCFVQDQQLTDACTRRIRRRLVPEIAKAFQFRVTRLERLLVACYDSAEGGHFRPHRDNTTRGTAHRRFAVSLFLNSGEYEGGFLRFPEYGNALYSAPTGGAVVFSCSLLHQATAVTSGRRYMFLPFLYDEAAHLVREENRQYLVS